MFGRVLCWFAVIWCSIAAGVHASQLLLVRPCSMLAAMLAAGWGQPSAHLCWCLCCHCNPAHQLWVSAVLSMVHWYLCMCCPSVPANSMKLVKLHRSWFASAAGRSNGGAPGVLRSVTALVSISCVPTI